MSHPPPGGLGGYNSLSDRHLAGYFGNTRMKKHLKKSGLVSRNGTIVEDNTYRLKMAKKEHRKHVREMLATAIVHKALDMERMHQYEMKRKLEELYKVELVQRIRAERSRKGEEEVLNLLPTRVHRELSNARSRKQKESPRSPNSLPDIHYDQSRKRLYYQEKSPRRDGAEMPKSREHPLERSFIQPHPPQRRKKKKGRTHRGLLLARTDSAVAHRVQLQSLAEVSLKYFGSNLHLSSDATYKSHLEEVTVYQQHCGGSTLCVFKELLSAGTQFSFISRRHRGSPFGLTFYVDGLQDCRLSSCCEYKHRPGHRIGGRNGRFAIAGINGAAPCYKCQVSIAMAESQKKKGKKQADSQSSSDSDAEGPQVSYDIIVSTLSKVENKDDIRDRDKNEGGDKDSKELKKMEDSDQKGEDGGVVAEESSDVRISQEQQGNEGYEEDAFDEDGDEENGRDSDNSDAASEVSSVTSSISSSSSSSDEESEDEQESVAKDREGEKSDDEEKSDDGEKSDDADKEPEADLHDEEQQGNEIEAEEPAGKEDTKTEGIEQEENVETEEKDSSKDRSTVSYNKEDSTAEEHLSDHEEEIKEEGAAESKASSEDADRIETPKDETEPISEGTDKGQSADEVEEQDGAGEIIEIISTNAVSEAMEQSKVNDVQEQIVEEGHTSPEPEIPSSEAVTEDNFEPETPNTAEEQVSETKEPASTEESEQRESTDVAQECGEELESEDHSRIAAHSDGKAEDDLKIGKLEGERQVSSEADVEFKGKEEDDHGEEKEVVKSNEGDRSPSSSSSSSSDEEEPDEDKVATGKEEGIYSDSEPLALDRGNDPDAVASDNQPTDKPPSVEPAEQCDGSILPLLNSSTEVELSNIALNEGQVREIANLLGANEETDSLSLRNAQLNDDAVTTLMDAVKRKSRLKMLNLNLNNIGPDGARQIVQCLEENNDLKVLMLHGNPLGDEGIEIIITFLKTSNTITSLDLGGCQFGEQGMKHLASLVETTESLTDLTLTGNSISTEGWKLFSDSLASNQTLVTLSVDYNKLGDDGIRALADPGFLSSKSLKSIDLEANGITDIGAEVILSVLEQNERIVDITLSPKNEISPSLLDKIKSILANRLD